MGHGAVDRSVAPHGLLVDAADLADVRAAVNLQDAQSAMVEALVTYRTSTDESTRRATARALLGRIRALKSLGQSLEDDYADIL